MRLLQKPNIEDILFIDIETAAATNSFDESHPLYEAWHYDHMRNVETEEELIDLYHRTAPLYAEYGRIVCVTIGAVRDGEVILKSFYGEDEKQILIDLNESLDKFVTNKTLLCGHNIIDFDMPYLAKRYLVHQVYLPLILDTAHLKPWETSTLDTALLWKGTGWKKQSFLSVLSALGLPSPKDDIDGSQVSNQFYLGNIKRIVEYCEKDVFGCVNLVRKLRYEEPFEKATSLEDYTPAPMNIIDFLKSGGQYDEDIERQLIKIMKPMKPAEKAKAIEILNCLPTKAKGKETFITKKDISELCTKI